MPNGLLYQKEYPDDGWLLAQMREDNYAAFSSLYEKYIRVLTSYGFRFTSDLQVIEDCIHDLFVWVWQHRQTLSIQHSLKSYFLKSVRLAILKVTGRQQRFMITGDHPDSFVDGIASCDEYDMEAEDQMILQQKLAAYISHLTWKQREVIYLRFYQGLNFEEIAHNMDLTIKACYKLMGRAISELRKTVPHPISILSFLVLLD